MSLVACGGGDEAVDGAAASGTGSRVVAAAGLVPGSVAAATTNTDLLQGLLSAGGSISFTTEGVYCINATLTIPSDTTFYLGAGVVLVRLAGGNACTAFANADPVAGNLNVKLYGEGVIYCNANGYANTYNANPTDCPSIPALQAANIAGIFESGGSINLTNPSDNGLQFDNVNGLYVGGLTIMQAAKYQLYGSAISNFVFENLVFYGDDTINPANVSTLGRDSIHIQGNSAHGIIRDIRGTSNDDFIVLNCRDVAGQITSRSVGNIHDIDIQNIHGKNQRRGGAGVHIYGGLDVGTVDPKNSNGFDTAPVVADIAASTGAIYTVKLSAEHQMVPGQYFVIFGSSLAGFNTNASTFAGPALGTPLGRVIATPSATTLTYVAPGGAGMTYAGGAKLVRIYAMSNIRVDGIDQQVFAAGALSLGVTGDSAFNSSVIDNCSFKNITSLAQHEGGVSGVLDHSGAGGSSSFCKVIDSTFENVTSQNDTGYAIYNAINNAHFDGVVTFNGIRAQVTYRNTPQGQHWANFTQYATLVLNGLDVTLLEGAPFPCAVTTGCAGGNLLINGPRITQGGMLQVVGLLNLSQGALGNIVINDPVTGTTGPGDVRTFLANIGDTVTSGVLSLNGLSQAFPWFSPMITYHGTGMTINLQSAQLVGNYGPGTGGVIQYDTGATLSVNSVDNAYGSQPLFNSNSWTTAISLRSNDLSQTIPYSPTITPDLSLGGNITCSLNGALVVANPRNISPQGQQVTFTLKEGGIGAFAVSWSPVYVFPTAWSNSGNAAFTASTVTFVSSGERLIATGANVWF